MSIILLTVGSLILSLTLDISRDSHEGSHQSATLAASQSGLDAALMDLRTRCAALTAPNRECTNLSLDRTYNDPTVQALGNACYQYWYGAIDHTRRTVQVHILAASPYQNSANGVCELRSTDPGGSKVNNINGKFTALVATVNLNYTCTTVTCTLGSSGSTVHTFPRVSTLRFNEDYTRG
jgi:hypothetical protein